MKNLKVSIPINVDEQGADYITLINEYYMEISGREGKELGRIEDFKKEILVEVIKYLAKNAEIKNEGN